MAGKDVSAKEKMKFMAERFGFCRCTKRCEVEQYADEDMRDKPGGCYSVCAIEAERAGIEVPTKEGE